MPEVPVAEMIIGKPVEDAAELLPRLFSLCREAQSSAARAAFGLALTHGWQQRLREEILREHMVKICHRWPAMLGLPPLRLPQDWMQGSAAARAMLFGFWGRLPETPEEFDQFLIRGEGAANVLRHLSLHFLPGEASRPAMRAAGPLRFFEDWNVENSVGGRQARHPVLIAIEEETGRGPLWSATAMLYDLEAMINQSPLMVTIEPGAAVIPAARGVYGVRAEVERGRVVAFERRTPTDHLLAPGGVLDHVLATLPGAAGQAAAEIALAVLDPCVPVKLDPIREVREDA